MVAGRELDQKVHVHVFGRELGTKGKHAWEPFVEKSDSKWCPHCGLLWFNENPEPDRVCEAYVGMYSTDIAAAWEVVDKMKADGWAWHVGGQYARSENPWCSFRSSEYADNVVTKWGDTVPHAICLAALASTPLTAPEE